MKVNKHLNETPCLKVMKTLTWFIRISFFLFKLSLEFSKSGAKVSQLPCGDGLQYDFSLSQTKQNHFSCFIELFIIFSSLANNLFSVKMEWNRSLSTNNVPHLRQQHFNPCDNAAHISYHVNGSTRSNSFSFVVLFNKQDQHCHIENDLERSHQNNNWC